MKKITEETMEYIGILAKLELSEEEKQAAAGDMEQMLAFFDKLQELDTTGVEPAYQRNMLLNVMREDTVEDRDGREELLANAPETAGGMLRVPRTFA